MTEETELFIAGSPDDLAREAASRFVALAAEAIGRHGRFSVALSGGSTPRCLYTLLTESPFLQLVDWSKVYLFFADERFVPLDHEDSTYRLVAETLLSGAPIPKENIFPIPTNAQSAEEGAKLYATELSSFFGGSTPSFDLMLLGMGPDGHTASLFPGRSFLEGAVAAVYDSPKPPPTRITLTFSLINHARNILFLVTGGDKAKTLKEIFTQSGETDLPAARVLPVNGTMAWLVDKAAASQIIE